MFFLPVVDAYCTFRAIRKFGFPSPCIYNPCIQKAQQNNTKNKTLPRDKKVISVDDGTQDFG